VLRRTGTREAHAYGPPLARTPTLHPRLLTIR
jgi:hypothetical protein